MKANIFRIATITMVSVITLSVTAQNTKSFKERSFASNITHLVSYNVSNMGHELAVQIDNLKSMIKFNPENNFEYESAEAISETIDLTQLESAAKFNPAISGYEISENEESINSTLDELKTTVRYQPVLAVEETENETLITISDELASIVKYQPSNIL